MATMCRKDHQRCSQAPQAEMAKAAAPEHPFVWTLLGSSDSETLKAAKQVYSREYVVALCVLPHRQQDECMRELCQEHTRHIARASLEGKNGPARPSLRSQSCFLQPLHFMDPIPLSWASRGWVSQVTRRRHLDRMIKVKKVFPSHPWSHPTNKQLSCSTENLHLQLRSNKFRCRVQQDNAPTPVEEKTKRKSGLTWMRSWATSLHCPWTWPCL